jgi:calcium/calmodulin-dependent protein kinase I
VDIFILHIKGRRKRHENLMESKDAQASRDFKAKYDVAHVLGTGAFSEVRLATNISTGEKVAVKIIDKDKCKGKEGMIETEVRILQRMNHPNIVKLYEKFDFGNKIYLIMELVTGGELFDEIVGRGSFPESEAAVVVAKILDAIRYLHNMGIVHRDLKPENLLLSSREIHSEIKISDFGLSKIFNEVEVMKTACGTPGYVAPEVLRRQGYGSEVGMVNINI